MDVQLLVDFGLTQKSMAKYGEMAKMETSAISIRKCRKFKKWKILKMEIIVKLNMEIWKYGNMEIIAVYF
jgi:hypothetical protein